MIRRCAAALLLLTMGCDSGAGRAEPEPEPEPHPEPKVPTVTVVDEAGEPLQGAFVLAGGAPQVDWLITDAAGRTEMPALGDPRNDPYVTVAKRGFWSGGGRRPDDGSGMDVTLRQLPDPAETTYVFARAGDVDDMAGTDRCMHCHTTLGEQWNRSAHKRALSNPVTLALYEEAVAAGAAAAQACGDCHGVVLAAPAGRPDGGFDLSAPPASPEAEALRAEGVTCDVCHKIADVTPDPARPGLQGSLSLLLPSIPSASPISEYEPLQFGPHGDILNPFMGGAYQPQFREAVLCAGCHSLHQPIPEDAFAADVLAERRQRWPDGLPILQTWQEWRAGPMSAGPTCQGCHMPTLDEETGAGDISANGWSGDTSVGMFRPLGEVRRHDWPAVAELGPNAVSLSVELAQGLAADELIATIRLTNAGAGHALPTGEPLRQIAVLLTAALPPLGGHAIPAHGGASRTATLGEDAAYDAADRSVTLTGTAPPPETAVVRLVRPTGAFDDYEGPGVGWFSAPETTPQGKGLPLAEVVGESVVQAVDAAAGRLVLATPLPDPERGDVVYLLTDPALQWAGAPGWLGSKLLVDATGAGPAHHGQVADIRSDNRLAPGASATFTVRYPLPADAPLVVTARAIHRKRPADLALPRGWPTGDTELARTSAAWPPEPP